MLRLYVNWRDGWLFVISYTTNPTAMPTQCPTLSYESGVVRFHCCAHCSDFLVQSVLCSPRLYITARSTTFPTAMATETKQPSDGTSVDISGLTKLEVLRALWEATQTRGFSLQLINQWSDDKALQLLDEQECDVEYVFGRPINACLKGNAFDPHQYDRDAEGTTAFEVVAKLRAKKQRAGENERPDGLPGHAQEEGKKKPEAVRKCMSCKTRDAYALCNNDTCNQRDVCPKCLTSCTQCDRLFCGGCSGSYKGSKYCTECYISVRMPEVMATRSNTGNIGSVAAAVGSVATAAVGSVAAAVGDGDARFACDGCPKKVAAHALHTCAGCEARLCGEKRCELEKCANCDARYCKGGVRSLLKCVDELVHCEECEDRNGIPIGTPRVGPCCAIPGVGRLCAKHKALWEAEQRARLLTRNLLPVGVTRPT